MLGEIALLDKRVGPYSLQQFVFRDYAARIGHQVKQHFKRFRRQWHADTLAQQRAGTNPQLEFAEAVYAVGRGHPRTPTDHLIVYRSDAEPARKLGLPFRKLRRLRILLGRVVPAWPA